MRLATTGKTKTRETTCDEEISERGRLQMGGGLNERAIDFRGRTQKRERFSGE